MTASTGTVTGLDHPLRCARCDVAWRGVEGDACWVCGDPGQPRGEVRIVEDSTVEDSSVEDEPAA